MTTVRVEPNPLVLAFAAGYAGPYIWRRFPKLREWISGDKKPTLRQLESFAKATDVPFGFFLLSEFPDVQLFTFLYDDDYERCDDE